MSLYSRLDRLAADVEKLNRQVTAVANSPQSQRTSVEGGSIDFNDADGNLMAIVGGQDDGGNTINVLSGPTPPTPTNFTVTVDHGSLTVHWDGDFEGGAVAPTDWARWTAYAQSGGFVVPDRTTSIGGTDSASGGEVTAGVLKGEWTVTLLAWSQAGKPSAMAEPVTVDVPGYGDIVLEEIDAAETEIKNGNSILVNAQDTLGGKLDSAFGQLDGINDDLSDLGDAVAGAVASANGKNTVHFDDRAPSSEGEEEVIATNYFTNPNFVTDDVFAVSGSLAIIDERAVLTATGGSTYVAQTTPAATGAWLSASVDVEWRSAGRARLQVQFRDASGTSIAAAQTVVDRSALPDGGRISVKGQIPDGTANVITYFWGYQEGSYTNLPVGQSIGTDRWACRYLDTEAEADAAPAEFFDGSTPAEGEGASAVRYRWTGEANASTSEKYTTTADVGIAGDTWFVGQVGRPNDVVEATNLMPNPSFETAATVDVAHANITLTNPTVAGSPSGGRVLRATMKAGSHGTYEFSGQYSANTHGAQWVAAALMSKPGAGNTSKWRGVRLADTIIGGSTEHTDITGISDASGWTRQVATKQLRPNASYARFVLYYQGSSAMGSAPVAGDVFESDSWVVATGDSEASALAKIESYFDGDTPSGDTDNESHYRWTGTPHASTSEKYLPATDGLSDKWNVTEQYRHDGTGWVQVELSHSVISSVDVGALTAGSAAIKEAVVQKLFAEVVVSRMSVADEFIGENAILTGAVTAPKITASEELWAKIGEFVKIRAEHIEADAIDGMVITGATIRSAATGARTLMSASGFEAYDNTGKRTFFASASTGNVSMTGELYTGEPGSERVVLDNSLWTSVEVTDPDTGAPIIVPGAGVRIGVSALSGADIYHAASTGSSGRYVDQAVLRGPGGRAKTIYGAVSAANGLPSSNYVLSTASDNSGKLAAEILATVGGKGSDTRKAELVGRDTSGKERALVQVIGGNSRVRTMAVDSNGVETSEVQVNGEYRNATIIGRDSSGTTTALVGSYGLSGESWVEGSGMYPLIVNYTGTGDNWFSMFQKRKTAWGYVGSTGAMGADDFGIQSASGKNLNLRASGGAEIILTSDTGSDARVKSITIASTRGGTTSDSAPVVIRPSSGVMYTPSSSARYKQDIGDAREMASILDVQTRRWRDRGEVESIANLERFRKDVGEGPVPREFADISADPPFHFGAIAEEVDGLGLSELVRYDAYGRPDGLHYEMFGVALIPEVRKLRDRITELERLTNE